MLLFLVHMARPEAFCMSDDWLKLLLESAIEILPDADTFLIV